MAEWCAAIRSLLKIVMNAECCIGKFISHEQIDRKHAISIEIQYGSLAKDQETLDYLSRIAITLRDAAKNTVGPDELYYWDFWQTATKGQCYTFSFEIYVMKVH